ncbi:gastrula zinc finger protein XlCGF49.1-like [Branchiostoma floridae]|uniref:Gastrula zinc finger protein XlCGF49.1-like n=1 Tax=Branchiostoma floridae TaxID=7739 RepID=A0A9J7HW42_BRAFL|nr:gastrula zinc finger protein XlCGF49.1-like [Branchiostoma floridae]
MGDRSGEVTMDHLSTVHPEDEANSSKTLDKGRQQNKEETCGVNSDNHVQVPTKQSDRSAAKRTVDKRFSCSECDYRAAFRSKLLIHTRKHTGEKPYKCDQCDYSAAQKGNLDQHMVKHTGEKPYLCQECGYRTADRSRLSVHMKTHTGMKPYKCIHTYEKTHRFETLHV